MLSIIIPSYNSEKTILDLLKSIYLNRSFLPPYEIIIIDSSDDKTVELVQKKFLEVKIVKLKEKTSAPVARNIGINKSKYNYLMFIDSDCELILREKLNLKEMDGKITGGFVYPKNFKNGVSLVQYMMEFIDFTPYEKTGEKSFVPSCIMIFPKKVNNNPIKFPTFSHSLYKNVSEDISICKIERERGVKTFFTDKFGARHKNRENFLDLKKHISNLGFLSGKTRKILKVKGNFLKYFPIFSITLIPYRFMRIYIKLLKLSLKDKKFFRGFKYPHLLIYFLFFWWINFYKGLKSE